jgi:hypothetical protein
MPYSNHGNAGNSHAKKDLTRSCHIQVRATLKEKETLKALADKEGVSMSKMVISLINGEDEFYRI